MDKIDKALLKLSDKQRHKLMGAFSLVVNGQLDGLNITKLKGHKDLYRLRIGNTRLIYRKTDQQQLVVVYVGKRDEQTYRNF